MQVSNSDNSFLQVSENSNVKPSVKTKQPEFIFVNFHDEDGVIDASDVKYVQANVESEEVKNFFKQFEGQTVKWTKALKKQFNAILSKVNNTFAQKSDLSEDLKSTMDGLDEYRPKKVIYNEDGKVSQKICYDDNGDTANLYYDDNGNLTRIKKDNGVNVTFEYDSNNRLLTRKNSKGQVKEYKYDDNGNIANTTTISGNTVSQEKYEYDAQNRVVKEILSSGVNGQDATEDCIITYTYNSDGSVNKRAFLPNGKEFANLKDAGWYVNKIKISLSFNGNKNESESLTKNITFK